MSKSKIQIRLTKMAYPLLMDRQRFRAALGPTKGSRRGRKVQIVGNDDKGDDEDSVQPWVSET